MRNLFLLLSLILVSCKYEIKKSESEVTAEPVKKVEKKESKVDKRKFTNWKSQLKKRCHLTDATGLKSSQDAIEGIDVKVFKDILKKQGAELWDYELLVKDYSVIFEPDFNPYYDVESDGNCEIIVNGKVIYKTKIVPTIPVIAVIPMDGEELEQLQIGELKAERQVTILRKIFKNYFDSNLVDSIGMEVTPNSYSTCEVQDHQDTIIENRKNFITLLSKKSQYDDSNMPCRKYIYNFSVWGNGRSNASFTLNREEIKSDFDNSIKRETYHLIGGGYFDSNVDEEFKEEFSSFVKNSTRSLHTINRLYGNTYWVHNWDTDECMVFNKNSASLKIERIKDYKDDYVVIETEELDQVFKSKFELNAMKCKSKLYLELNLNEKEMEELKTIFK